MGFLNRASWIDWQKNRELDFESVQIKPNLKCNYPSPIDLDANGILFGKKLFRKL